MTIKNKLAAIAIAFASYLSASTLAPSHASAASYDYYDFTIKSVRTTSAGDLLITFSGGRGTWSNTCTTGMFFVNKLHADYQGTSSIAMAALLSGRTASVWLSDGADKKTFDGGGVCAVIGLRINS